MSYLHRFYTALAASALAFALLASFAVPARANSAPPPPAIWFYLDDQTGASPGLQGAQLLGCEDSACAQPMLLQQFGVCSSPECLGGQPDLRQNPSTWIDHFTCDDLRCYSSTYKYGRPSFRLVLQYSDRARTHRESLPLPQSYLQTNAWQVSVLPDKLELRATSVQPVPQKTAPPFWLGLILTQVVELAVAAFYLAFILPRLERKKALAAQRPSLAGSPAGENALSGELPAGDSAVGATSAVASEADARANAERIVAEMVAAQGGRRLWPGGGLLADLGKLFLINLLTFPAVWGFFPALRGFVSPGERSAAWALLLFTWTLAVLLGVFFTLRPSRWRWVSGILMGLAIPSGLFCLGLYAFAANYGYRGYIGPGFSLPVILLLSEIYAVLAEALLFFWYTRPRLAWYHALALSLLANLASFIAGTLLLS